MKIYNIALQFLIFIFVSFAVIDRESSEVAFLQINNENFKFIDENISSNIALEKPRRLADPSPVPSYYSYQWGINKVSLPLAWDITTGSEEVVVGVIDSGINGSHPDLIDRIETSMCAELEESIIYTSNPIPSLESDGYHGTMVAGVIGAQRDSGLAGITGVSQNVRIASLRVINPDSLNITNVIEKYVASIERALKVAEDNGIKVVNISSGYYSDRVGGTPTQNNKLLEAIRDYPGLVVCAAGNTNRRGEPDNNNDVKPVYPANFELNNLITVGATNEYDGRVLRTNYGISSVDIYAPGESIYSTTCSIDGQNNFYQYGSGTSLSAPFVSGVAALLLSVNPNLTPRQIKEVIVNNSDLITISTPSGNQNVKRLNAFKAVSAVAYTYDYTPDNLYITGLASGLELAKGTKLTIPDEVRPPGYVASHAIESIASNAFEGQTNLTSITIPSTVQVIEDEAFLNCVNLESITMSNSIISNGKPFKGCTKIYGTLISTTETQHRIIDYSGAITWNNHYYTHDRTGECYLCSRTHTDHTYVTKGTKNNHYDECSTCYVRRNICTNLASLVLDGDETIDEGHHFYCASCDRSLIENHQYYNGVCSPCGHYHIDHNYSGTSGGYDGHYKGCSICYLVIHCETPILVSYIDEESHLLSCSECYFEIDKEHRLGISNTCVDCSYQSPLPHVHVYNFRYLPGIRGKHTAYCACGASKQEYHSMEPGENGSICVRCGYTERFLFGLLEDSDDNEVVYIKEEEYYLLPEDYDINLYL